MSTNPESIDGVPVVSYTARFTKPFDIPDEWGTRLRLEEIGTALVTFTVSKMGGTTNKDSDRVRSNTFEVLAVDEVDPSVIQSLQSAQTVATNTLTP